MDNPAPLWSPDVVRKNSILKFNTAIKEVEHILHLQEELVHQRLWKVKVHIFVPILADLEGRALQKGDFFL